jgi:hypothetical protein
MRATLLTLLCLFLMLVLTGGVPASAQQMRANDSGMSATVAPATGLYNNQVVNLSWSGFPAGGAVYVRECASNATDLDKCVQPPGDFAELVSDENGSGLVRYSIVEGPLGNFTCDAEVGDDCSLFLMTAPPDVNSGPHVQLKWAPDQGPCPGANGPPVGGEGAAPAAYTMYAWEAAGCKTAQHLSVTYTNDNSYDGISHMADSFPGTNFAVTGVPLPAADANHIAKKKLGFGYAPLTLTGVAIGYNIIDQNGNQVQNLVLTPHILAEIATNELSSFYCPAKASPSKCINDYGGDPEIQKLNPGVQFPTGPVQFFIRSEHSASNLAFSTWLSDNASDIWTYGATQTWPPEGSPPSIPQGVTGEANTAHAVGFPTAYDPNQVYIGVMDTTDAAINDIPVASLVQNGVTSTTGVAPTAASLGAAVADGTKNADGTITPDYTTQDPTAYPMPMLTYAAVPTTQGWPHFTADDGKMLKAFLDYTSTDGQSLLPTGSFPLPKTPTDMTAETRTVAAKIPTTEPTKGGGGKKPTGGKHRQGGTGNTGTGGSGTGGTGSTGTGFTGTPLPQTSNGSPPPGGSPPSSSSNPVGAGKPGGPSASGLPKIAFADVGNIAAPTSSAVQPVLITLAILGLLIAPVAVMLSRRDRPLDMSSMLNSIKLPRRLRPR